MNRPYKSFVGVGDAPPAPKNIFLFYLKIYLIVYIQKNKLKFTMFTVNYRNIKQYAKYILVYIKVKILETLKYDRVRS